MSGEKGATWERVRLEGGSCRGLWRRTRRGESAGLKQPEETRSQQLGEAVGVTTPLVG